MRGIILVHALASLHHCKGEWQRRMIYIRPNGVLSIPNITRGCRAATRPVAALLALVGPLECLCRKNTEVANGICRTA